MFHYNRQNEIKGIKIPVKDKTIKKKIPTTFFYNINT